MADRKQGQKATSSQSASRRPELQWGDEADPMGQRDACTRRDELWLSEADHRAVHVRLWQERLFGDPVLQTAHRRHQVWSCESFSSVSRDGKKVVLTSEKKPSSAASSFISGLIREPLQGQPSVCPIATSADDSILDNLPVYISRTKTVVRNIAYALCMPDEKFKGRLMGRTINLPGISITPRQILQALYVLQTHDAITR